MTKLLVALLLSASALALAAEPAPTGKALAAAILPNGTVLTVYHAPCMMYGRTVEGARLMVARRLDGRSVAACIGFVDGAMSAIFEKGDGQSVIIYPLVGVEFQKLIEA